MPRKRSDHPTEMELRILKILWSRAPQAVREIRQALSDEGHDIAHTSVITTLNIMVRKRYLQRTSQGNAYLFSPSVSREQVSQGMLGDVVNRVFDGSASAVMLSLLQTSELKSDEIKELRRLINRMAKEQS